jgi:F0F1-type ATP synthase membrane subunit c/vacuolar-type H+-ATPase subunit K
MMSITPNDSGIRRPWFNSLAAGLFLAFVALVVAPIAGLDVRWTPGSDGGGITAIVLFVGVLGTGWVLWALLPARPGGHSIRRGGIVGVLTACLSYPVVLLLAEFFQADWQSGADATTIFGRIVQVLVLAGLALLTTGFLAVLLLGLAGIVAGAIEGRTAPAAPDQTSRRPSLAGRIIRAFSYVVLGLVALLTLSFFGLSFWPIEPIAAPTPPAAATTHDEALEAFALIEAEEATLDLNPRCKTSLLTHGRKVKGVVIFYHGLTNCPAQADELAPMLFALGYNVLVPRLPGHGMADSMTLALADVDAEDFVATAETATALAHGLGEEVIVTGLSAGGAITAYQAQSDAELASSISMAPFLAPGGAPGWSIPAATNLILLLPNLMLWWDPRSPYPSSPPMDYAYPRFATHALAEVMRLGLVVSGAAKGEAPSAPHVGMLLNAADRSINNTVAEGLAASWEGNGVAVDLRMLPEALGLPHDMVDPRQATANTDVVYPVIVEMISAGTSGP